MLNVWRGQSKKFTVTYIHTDTNTGGLFFALNKLCIYVFWMYRNFVVIVD